MTQTFTSNDLINYANNLCEENPILAQHIISKAIKENPFESIAYYNLGIYLHMQRKPKAAIRAYKKSIQLPGEGKISAKKNLAQDLLLIGNFKEGWEAYENRFKKNENLFFQKKYGKAWKGLMKNNPLPKNLILVSEQGYGDTIQFCRFAIIFIEMGVNVIFFCQKKLIPLLEENSQIKYITDTINEDYMDEETEWCPLMSIPLKLNINNNNIPCQYAYIKVDERKVISWKNKLKRKKHHKLIGLSWQGTPDFEKRIYSKGRSMHFNNLLKLKQIEGIEFVSLQKDSGANQLITNANLLFVEGQSNLTKNFDFRDTAAVISQCDLVISTDNVITHLSGAIGIQTWVALKWVPEWRWGLNSNFSRWYPSVRLFRQSSEGNWASVIENINKELIKKFEG